jgi:hypothetical protein
VHVATKRQMSEEAAKKYPRRICGEQKREHECLEREQETFVSSAAVTKRDAGRAGTMGE